METLNRTIQASKGNYTLQRSYFFKRQELQKSRITGIEEQIKILVVKEEVSQKKEKQPKKEEEGEDFQELHNILKKIQS